MFSPRVALLPSLFLCQWALWVLWVLSFCPGNSQMSCREQLDRGFYHFYLCIENGNVLIAVYLFICLYACTSHNSKSIKPNRMKFGGMIGYYPGTI